MLVYAAVAVGATHTRGPSSINSRTSEALTIGALACAEAQSDMDIDQDGAFVNEASTEMLQLEHSPSTLDNIAATAVPDALVAPAAAPPQAAAVPVRCMYLDSFRLGYSALSLGILP